MRVVVERVLVSVDVCYALMLMDVLMDEVMLFEEILDFIY